MGADAAAVFFDDRANDGEAEAGAFGGIDRRIRYAVKAFEDALEVAAGDADAVIADIDLSFILAGGFEPDRDSWLGP